MNDYAFHAGVNAAFALLAMPASAPKEAHKLGSLSRMVEDLVLNTSLSYEMIVHQVKEAYPQAATSTKSVASVACVMRKKGKPVPYRLKLNA
jgi:hypothetical protein